MEEKTIPLVERINKILLETIEMLPPSKENAEDYRNVIDAIRKSLDGIEKALNAIQKMDVCSICSKSLKRKFFIGQDKMDEPLCGSCVTESFVQTMKGKSDEDKKVLKKCIEDVKNCKSKGIVFVRGVEGDKRP